MCCLLKGHLPVGAGAGTGAGTACGSSYLSVWTRASGDILVPAKIPVRKELCGGKPQRS